MFDIQMFTALNFANSQTVNSGEVLKGRQSGATAFVYSGSGASCLVHQVSGDFQIGEVITRDGRVLDTLDAVYAYEQSDVRQVVGKDGATVIFTASLALNLREAIPGTTINIDATGGNDRIEGFGTRFESDIRAGEVLTATNTDFKAQNSIRVKRIDQTAIGFTDQNRNDPATAVVFDFTNQHAALDTGLTKGTVPDAEYPAGQVVRLRPRFATKTVQDGELVIDMPKHAIKSISDESFVVIKTFANKQLSSGDVTFTLPENEQFTTLDSENYILTVTQGANSHTGYGWNVGTNIDIENESTKNSPTIGVTFGANRQSLQVTGMNQGSGGASNITEVTLTAAVSVNTVSKKIKTAAKMRVMKVVRTRNNTDVQNYGLTYGNLYGTRIEDEEISFALNDVYKLHAVYAVSYTHLTLPTICSV